MASTRSVTEVPSSPEDPLLDGWYHTIELGNGMVSRGRFDHRTIVDLYGIPESLEGMTVLDVATGDGFFAFEMERRGAARVVAVDVDRVADCDWLTRMRCRVPRETMAIESWRQHFEMAHTLRRSKVERIPCSVYDLSPAIAGTFDFVFCGDLLLHLQNPLRALENIRSVTRHMAVIETVIDPVLEDQHPETAYIRFGAIEDEREPGELNSYWRVNTKALRDMLIYAGFASTEPYSRFTLPPVGIPATSVIAWTGPVG